MAKHTKPPRSSYLAVLGLRALSVGGAHWRGGTRGGGGTTIFGRCFQLCRKRITVFHFLFTQMTSGIDDGKMIDNHGISSWICSLQMLFR